MKFAVVVERQIIRKHKQAACTRHLFSRLLMTLYSASTGTQYCDLNEIFVGESCCRHTGCDVEECSREERVSTGELQ